MTDTELMALPKVGTAEAARYLQNGSTALDVRLLAQSGRSPYCTAELKTPGSKRYTYRVHIGLLMRYKRGELGL